jgi:thiamine-phosphate pyrophosphorylase
MTTRTIPADRRYYRLIDANLNRCREGLRVIEDTARFILVRVKYYRRLRAIRHELDILTRKTYPELLRHRDADADPGRTLKEGGRDGIPAVIASNFRRIEESLRVLEEYGKLVSASASSRFKKIRFEIYTIEKSMLADKEKI